MRNRTVFTLILIIMINILTGITLVSWDFAGNTGSEATVVASVYATNISTVSPSGVISRGLGLIASGNQDRFNGTNWGTGSLDAAITAQDYMQFSIIPSEGYAMNITAIHMRVQHSSTGPTTFTFRSNQDEYATNIGSFTYAATTTSIEQTITITGITAEPNKVTFRMYGTGASSSTGSAGFEGTGVDLEILGTVVANYTIPTVITSAITGISHYGCTAGGNVTDNGGVAITARGVVVSTLTYPAIGAPGVMNFPATGASTGSYTVNVTGLLPNTLYYVNAYATNLGGTAYGTQTSFTTGSFPAPILLQATNVTNSSFRANWSPVVDAASYRIDVATAPEFTEASSSTLLSEPFNGGVTAPTGWTFTGITEVYTGAGYYGLAAPAIKFDHTNDWVTTATFSNPQTLSFWVKGTGTSGASTFKIEEFYASAWHEVAALTPTGVGILNLPTSGTTKTFNLNSASTQIRFSYIKVNGNVGLDDVVINGLISTNTYVPGYQDLLVSGTSQNVTGLTYNHTYYYRVRALSSAGTLSPNSTVGNVTAVFTGTVESPSGFAATAVNSSTVSLQWTRNAANDNVMVAYSTGNTFGSPFGYYAPGAAITGGGTVLYNGSNTTCNNSGLNPNTHYYYRAWSVDSDDNYSEPVASDVTTPSGASETIKVHYIDVRQGDSILIQRGTFNYLIDSGKDLSSDKLITYLQSQNVTHIDACMISHPDFDHYGEFEQLVLSNTVTIDKFVKNNDPFTSVAGADLMALLATRNIPVEIVGASTDLNWVVDTDILSPVTYTASENDNSIVVKMLYGNISFLFTGDVETAANNYLVNNYDMNIDILKVSHHGSINGTTQAFLNEATPAISVISVGNNSFGHPSYDIISMLQNAGSQIYSTADDWNTWTGNGSSDLTEDDDIILETDGTHVWKNGTLVWTATTSSIAAPQNVSVSILGNQLSISWDSVPTAISYSIFGTATVPYETYTNISATGTFGTNGTRSTWTASVSPAEATRFYYVTAIK